MCAGWASRWQGRRKDTGKEAPAVEQVRDAGGLGAEVAFRGGHRFGSGAKRTSRWIGYENRGQRKIKDVSPRLEAPSP